MTAAVPQAAVDAAQLARGCSPIYRTVGERRGPLVCNTHGCEWSDAGCLVAIDVAAAVVAAVQGPIKAEALREAADGVPLFEFMLVMDVASEVAPGQITAWLRDRADRIEAQP